MAKKSGKNRPISSDGTQTNNASTSKQHDVNLSVVIKVKAGTPEDPHTKDQSTSTLTSHPAVHITSDCTQCDEPRSRKNETPREREYGIEVDKDIEHGSSESHLIQCMIHGRQRRDTFTYRISQVEAEAETGKEIHGDFCLYIPNEPRRGIRISPRDVLDAKRSEVLVRASEWEQMNPLPPPSSRSAPMLRFKSVVEVKEQREAAEHWQEAEIPLQIEPKDRKLMKQRKKERKARETEEELEEVRQALKEGGSPACLEAIAIIEQEVRRKQKKREEKMRAKKQRKKLRNLRANMPKLELASDSESNSSVDDYKHLDVL